MSDFWSDPLSASILQICRTKGFDEAAQMCRFMRVFIICKYRKVPKFSDARKLCCNLPKIQTNRPKLKLFYQNDANGIAYSEDPDQTTPLGAV